MVMDFLNSICRTCLSDSNKLISVFSAIETKSDQFEQLYVMFNNLTELNIVENDTLPTLLCKDCVDELRKSYLFKLKCLDANSVLVKLADEVNATEEFLDDEIIEKQSDTDEIKQEEEEEVEDGETFLTEDESVEQLKLEVDDPKDQCVEEEYESEVIQDEMMNDENVEIYEIEEGAEFDPFFDSSEAIVISQEEIEGETEDFQLIQDRYLCTICDKTFENGTLLMEHDEEHKLDEEFSCRESCGKKFNTFGAFETHKFSHFLLSEVCRYCKLICSSPEDLADHVAKHDPELPYKCPACENSYTHQYMLKNHFLKKHATNCSENTRVKTCRFCDNRFLNTGSLKKHMLTKHPDEKHLECNVCNKKFILQHQLTAHMRAHTETTVVCYICGKTLARRSFLEAHIKRHVGPLEEHACPICNRVFHSKYNMAYHMRRHDDNQRKYSCTLCDARFFDQRILKRHLAVHRGEKPYREIEAKRAKRVRNKNRESCSNYFVQPVRFE